MVWRRGMKTSEAREREVGMENGERGGGGAENRHSSHNRDRPKAISSRTRYQIRVMERALG